MSSLFALIASFVMMLTQAGPSRVDIQAGTAVRPETTTVGQHFIATIRVRVPVGYQIRFPARPDSAAQVDSAGPMVRTDSTAGGYTESTANYVLAAWDTGGQRLGRDSVTVVTLANAPRLVRRLRFFSMWIETRPRSAGSK